jgi:exonuclease VII large subunit
VFRARSGTEPPSTDVPGHLRPSPYCTRSSEPGAPSGRAKGPEILAATSSRAAALERLAQTLAAHEPDRVRERGYAIVTDQGGDVVSSAERARRESRVRVRFADDDVLTEVIDDE